MKRKVVNISHSVAFTDADGIIYVNKRLKDYDKELFRRILKHEKSHHYGKYDKHDFMLDFHNDISQWELLKFCIANPSGFMQYSPIVKIEDKLLISWLSVLKLIILFMVIFGIIIAFI